MKLAQKEQKTTRNCFYGSLFVRIYPSYVIDGMYYSLSG